MKIGESFVTVMGSEGFAEPQYSSHVKYATRAEAEAQGRAEAGNLGVKYES